MINQFLLWLLFLYFVIFPFGQVLRIEVVPPVVIHPVDLIAGFIALVWGTKFFLKKKINITPLSRSFVYFLVIVTFTFFLGSTRVTLHDSFVGFFYLIRLCVYVIFYFAVWDLARDKSIRKNLLNSLIAIGSFISLFGLIQYFFIPDLRFLASLNWDPHYYRLIGSFLDPAFTGILLVLVFTIIFSQMKEKGKEGRKIFLGFIFLLGILLTYSRASYLALFISLFIIYIVRRNLWIVIPPLVFIGVGMFFLPRPGGEGVRLERTSTINYRFENYKQSLEIGESYPLFGVGFNLYGPENAFRGYNEDINSHSASGADSSLLFLFATTGVAGVLIYFSLLTQIIKKGWENKKNVAGIALLASTFAILVHSSFSNTLFYPWVLGWQAILLGIQED